MCSAAGYERPILRAKLLRPQVTKDLIVRDRLLSRLDVALAMPLTIVVAPAGFGKTTLVSSWISELEAFQHGGKTVGLFTVLGFLVAAVLSVLGLGAESIG